MSAAAKLYLTRLTLKRDDAVVAPLLRDLLPRDGDGAMGIHHRLLWTLYADRLERRPGKAPFLWRRMDGNGCFMLLGPEPATENPYFRVETKPFDVSFRIGQHLAFELRLHATIDRKPEAGVQKRGQRTDIVLNALHRIERNGQARSGPLRAAAAHDATASWMERRGKADGFDVEALDVVSYRAVPPPRDMVPNGSLVGISDLRGVLRVTDPLAFMTRLHKGFGRMKAFGCGLMLVRPALRDD